jgi:hypothetical protein
MQLEERERLRLHALLNGSDKAVRQIEAAITHYAEMLPMARAAKQLPSEVKKDADDLHKALQTIVRIITNGGDAWEFFKSSAAADGLTTPLHQLTEALGPGIGEPGDALVFVAEQNAADLKPTKSRPRSPDKVSRISLMSHVANAARDAGVLISRNSTAFQEITAAVFLAANIHADPDHDIREFLKTITE